MRGTFFAGLPLHLNVKISRLAWEWPELARLLARELFGHELDREADARDQQFWPNNMVHGGFRPRSR